RFLLGLQKVIQTRVAFFSINNSEFLKVKIGYNMISSIGNCIQIYCPSLLLWIHKFCTKNEIIFPFFCKSFQVKKVLKLFMRRSSRRSENETRERTGRT